MKEIYVRDAAEFTRFLDAVQYKYDMELCAEWIYETYYDQKYMFLNHGDEEGNIKKMLFYNIKEPSITINNIRKDYKGEWDNVELLIGIEDVEDFKNWFLSLLLEKRFLFPPLDKLFTENECYFKFVDSDKPDDPNYCMEIMVKYLGK